MSVTVEQIRLADECWIALALLHREHPQQKAFSATEIRQRMVREWGAGNLRPGVMAHIYQHLVANAEPVSGRYRMFYRLPGGALRLFRPGDEAHPARRGKSLPQREEIPRKYHYLLAWYEQEFSTNGPPARTQKRMREELDPVLAMQGVGKEIWEGIDADAYVAELRSGWDEPQVRREGEES